MDLFIEIIVGEPLGKKFRLASGLKVGRKNCEILVDDPKISSYHATVVARGGEAKAKLFLKDNNSSNGIKFNDLRVPELFLSRGVEFRLGNTVFRVVEAEGKSTLAPEKKSDGMPKISLKDAEKPKIEKQSPIIILPNQSVLTPTTPPIQKPLPSAPAPVVPPPPTWRETLSRLIQSTSLRAADVLNQDIRAFNPPLKLSCVRGKQYGKTWILGYGPRQIGPKSLDLVLNESTAPPICFQVVPTATGCEFKTHHPDIVRLNGQKLTKVTLHAGDVIEILNSQLVVDFENAGN